MDEQKTVARGIRYPKEIDTWLRRAAKKANAKSVNVYIAQILSDAFDKRHDKS